MKLTSACGLAACLLLVACQSSTSGPRDNHWNIESVGPRVTAYFMGYDAETDGSWKDFQTREKQDINLTFSRHLMNDNPNNPMEHEIPVATHPRYPVSIVPDPITYFHIDALAWGVVTYGLGGVFIPIPVSSLLGFLEPGGPTEFWDGIEMTVTGSFLHESYARSPSTPDGFRVRNTMVARQSSY